MAISGKKGFGILLLIIFIGILIGSVVGEVLHLLLPDGTIKDFFGLGVEFGFETLTINLLIIKFTIGIMIKVNLIGILGIPIAAYIFRWY